MKTDERFSGYRVLIGCFLVMFVHLGMLSSLGIFIPRMVPDLNETLGRSFPDDILCDYQLHLS